MSPRQERTACSADKSSPDFCAVKSPRLSSSLCVGENCMSQDCMFYVWYFFRPVFGTLVFVLEKYEYPFRHQEKCPLSVKWSSQPLFSETTPPLQWTPCAVGRPFSPAIRGSARRMSAARAIMISSVPENTCFTHEPKWDLVRMQFAVRQPQFIWHCTTCKTTALAGLNGAWYVWSIELMSLSQTKFLWFGALVRSTGIVRDLWKQSNKDISIENSSFDTWQWRTSDSLQLRQQHMECLFHW